MAPVVCPWYLCYFFDNPLRRMCHRPEKMLGDYVSEGMTVLDLGCGMGYFSMGLARLVGPTGRVIAVDLQQKMLDGVTRRAERAGLSKRIETRLAGPDDLGLGDLAGQADFALAFWMVHEVPDQVLFFSQIQGALKADGRLLAVEPLMHVSERGFQELTRLAGQAGMNPSKPVRAIRLSRSRIFRPTRDPGVQ